MKNWEKIPLQNEKPGDSVLIQGPTNSGKTYSAVTCPDPILFVNREMKSPIPVHNAEFRDGKFYLPNGKRIVYVESENFDDEQAFLNDQINLLKEGNFPFKTVFNDGLNFGQLKIKLQLEDERLADRITIIDSKSGKPKAKSGIPDRYIIDLEYWGKLNSMMVRNQCLYNEISKFGVFVVTTSISGASPGYTNEFDIAPALEAKGFPQLLHGFFPYIGYIIVPYKSEIINGQRIVTEPIVSFINTKDDRGLSYMARCSSAKLEEMNPAPLDFEKILKVIRS